MRRTLELIGCAAVTVLSFALYTAVFLVMPICIAAAFAHEYRCHYVTRSRPVWDTWTNTVTTQYYQQRQCHRNHTYHYPEREPTRVYGYERRRDGDEYGGGVECKEHMRATGDDKLQQDNAEISAQERWALQAESRVGGIYSDIRYAANIRTTCVKRVPGSLTERGQAALGVRHFLCEVSARPCRAPAIRQDEDSRAKRKFDRVDDPAPAPARRDR